MFYDIVIDGVIMTCSIMCCECRSEDHLLGVPHQHIQQSLSLRLQALLLHLPGHLQFLDLEDHFTHLHGFQQSLHELPDVGVFALQPLLHPLQAAFVGALGHGVGDGVVLLRRGLRDVGGGRLRVGWPVVLELEDALDCLQYLQAFVVVEVFHIPPQFVP
jgi:hypothetical protein